MASTKPISNKAEKIPAADFPFGDLLDYLRARDFAIGIDTYLHVTRVIRSLPANANQDSVRNVIGPLVCKGPEDQESYRKYFDAFLRTLTATSTTVEPPVRETILDKIRRASKKFAAGALIILVAALAIYFSRDYIRKNKNTDREITADDSVKSDSTNGVPPVVAQEDTTKTAPDTTTGPGPVAITEADTLLRSSQIKLAKFKLSGPGIDLKNRIVTMSAWQQMFPQIAPIWAPLVAILFLVFIAWQFYKHRLVIREKKLKKPPFVWKIDVNEPTPIKMMDTFAQASSRLRRRVSVGQGAIDHNKTVISTVRHNGMLTLRFKQRSVAPEYLVLVDRAGTNNLYSDLMKEVVERFMRDDVNMNIYYFNHDPTVCWNEARPQGVLTHHLLSHHATSRLVIVGDGTRLIHPVLPELADPNLLLLEWKNRAILTPKPLSEWAAEEYILSEHFVVLPANNSGWSEMITCFDEEKQPDPWEVRSEFGIIENDPVVLIGRPDVDYKSIHNEIKRRGYPDVLMDWIGGCCMYPELNWSMMLQVGKALSDRESLLTQEYIDFVAGLEWFRVGRIDEQHRAFFLDKLTSKNRKKIAEAILQLLELYTPSKVKMENTFAYEDHALKLVTAKIMMEDDKGKILELKRELREREMLSTASGYYSVLSEVDHFKVNPLDFLLPNRLSKFLDSPSKATVVTKRAAAITLWLTFGALPYLLKPGPVCENNLVTRDSVMYCLENTRADSLAYALLDDSTLRYKMSLDTDQVTRASIFYNNALANFEKGDYPAAEQEFDKVKLPLHLSDPNKVTRLDSLAYFSEVGLSVSTLMRINRDSIDIMRWFKYNVDLLGSFTKFYPQFQNTNHEYASLVADAAREMLPVNASADIVRRLSAADPTWVANAFVISGYTLVDTKPTENIEVNIAGTDYTAVSKSDGGFDIVVRDMKIGATIKLIATGAGTSSSRSIQINSRLTSVRLYLATEPRPDPVDSVETISKLFEQNLGSYDGVVRIGNDTSSFHIRFTQLAPTRGELQVNGKIYNNQSAVIIGQGILKSRNELNIEGQIEIGKSNSKFAGVCRINKNKEMTCAFQTGDTGDGVRLSGLISAAKNATEVIDISTHNGQYYSFDIETGREHLIRIFADPKDNSPRIELTLPGYDKIQVSPELPTTNTIVKLKKTTLKTEPKEKKVWSVSASVAFGGKDLVKVDYKINKPVNTEDYTFDGEKAPPPPTFTGVRVFDLPSHTLRQSLLRYSTSPMPLIICPSEIIEGESKMKYTSAIVDALDKNKALVLDGRLLGDLLPANGAPVQTATRLPMQFTFPDDIGTGTFFKTSADEKTRYYELGIVTLPPSHALIIYESPETTNQPNILDFKSIYEANLRRLQNLLTERYSFGSSVRLLTDPTANEVQNAFAVLNDEIGSVKDRSSNVVIIYIGNASYNKLKKETTILTSSDRSKKVSDLWKLVNTLNTSNTILITNCFVYPGDIGKGTF